MKMFRSEIVAGLVVLTGMVGAQTRAVQAQGTVAASAARSSAQLDNVLREMDQASARFQSAEAEFRWDLYERIVKETTTQTGTIYFQRAGSGTEMGAVIAPPNARTLSYKNGVLRIFDTGIDQITELSARGNKAQYESFLTLGFGGSGSDLAKAWNITDMGAEAMTDGTKMVPTEKLDLVSKDPAVRNMFTHITIWVDVKRGISLKQHFYTPSDDQRTANYTNIRYNQKIDKKNFAIRTDRKTTTVRR